VALGLVSVRRCSLPQPDPGGQAAPELRSGRRCLPRQQQGPGSCPSRAAGAKPTRLVDDDLLLLIPRAVGRTDRWGAGRRSAKRPGMMWQWTRTLRGRC